MSEHIDTDAEDFIREARRPVIIARHRALLEEMESSLPAGFIDGSIDHPRARAMLVELEAASERARVEASLRRLADDEHYQETVLREALLDELSLYRDERGIEIAALQQHAIGIYRRVRALLSARQGGEAPTLSELRSLPTSHLGRLLEPPRCWFGLPGPGEPITPQHAVRVHERVRVLCDQGGHDAHWEDADGAPALSKADEQRLAEAPATERLRARNLLERDRIRSRFFRQVFVDWFARDQFDPQQAVLHPTVLAWLQDMSATPHMYPFLQGQRSGQKSFRIARLTTKLVQMHELYARVARASEDPRYRDRLRGLTTRERVAILAKEHYPTLSVDDRLVANAMLAPLAEVALWLQERLANDDLVLPPDPKR